MERRVVLFLVVSALVFVGYAALVQWLHPQPRRPPQGAPLAARQAAEKKKAPAGNEEEATKKEPVEEPAKEAEKPAPEIKVAPEAEPAEQWLTLGSADPDETKNPYRMLVTLGNKGAAIARIELSSSRYCDIDDRSGYLGHVVMSSADRDDGCTVQVVGPGTPAAEAGLQPGDVIRAVNQYLITDPQSLEDALSKTKPGRIAQIAVLREGEQMKLPVKLRRRPLEVIRPEEDDRSGYPGYMVMSAASGNAGCTVRAVKPGTPAAEAGIKPGDLITTVDQSPVTDLKSFEDILSKTKPGHTARMVVVRGGEELELSVRLRRRPLAVIKPEEDDPFSMLLTLQQFDKQKLVDESKKEEDDTKADEKPKSDKERAEAKQRRYDALIRNELPGVRMRTANWKVVAADTSHVEFQYVLPDKGLEITKIYRLVKVPEDSLRDSDFPAYHLEFQIGIRNTGENRHQVAYRLDGPNGLPTEGKWYATKVSRNWFDPALRDVVMSFGGAVPVMTSAATISAGTKFSHGPDTPPEKMLTFIGVDAQYFSAVLIPERTDPSDVWFDDVRPIRVGRIDAQRPNFTNTSCRLVSVPRELKPGGVIVHQFKLFAGPKKPSLLAKPEYRLGELVYFGWPMFAWFAVPLTLVLHVFYELLGNYGLAIILLTVLVRVCMFPLSRKQVLNAQKMQQLQPEIKKIHEKYKNNREAIGKAQLELYSKHNCHPVSGCLPVFIQIPVMGGLYRALMVAIELRDAPLINSSVRWCSNLAAPDMLFNWSRFLPAFVASPQGSWLGPYFNLLPILTIVLFFWQQKVLMPPPADEQAAMQQKTMQYMMIFMGVMFYKVSSGLCIYLIVQSLWGLVERRFLPKATPPAGTATGNGASTVASPAGGDMETRAQAKARARQEAQAAATKKRSWWK